MNKRGNADEAVLIIFSICSLLLSIILIFIFI